MTPEEIKRVRERLGLSQSAFGRVIGVAQETISRWELGKQKPCPLALDKLRSIANSQ